MTYSGNILRCVSFSVGGVGRLSGCRAPTCKGLDHPIDPAQWMNLQFGLFSIHPVVHNWSIKGLVNLRAVLSVGKCIESIKRSLAAYHKEQPML